jgi:hypothetical protein
MLGMHCVFLFLILPAIPRVFLDVVMWHVVLVLILSAAYFYVLWLPDPDLISSYLDVVALAVSS